MKTKIIAALVVFTLSTPVLGQPRLVDVEPRSFQTTEELEIKGEIGYLEVPENRNNPNSRMIRVKYARLRSLAEQPEAPLVYIEGGGGTSVWQAEDPDELTDWLELLAVSDLIFIDRRGEGDESLIYIWTDQLPEDVLVTEEAANAHYGDMVKDALNTFEAREVDVRGYNLEEEAKDVDELMTALAIDRYQLFGFSFGSSIGMAVMTLFPDRVERAVLAGSDAPFQSFNYPRYLDEHVTLIASLAKNDAKLSKMVPDFEGLLDQVMTQLAKEPAVVQVTNPVTGQEMDLKIGPFGLGLILRLDIDDYNDIPVLPRLLYTMDQGDYSLLTYFAQRRLVFSLAVPGSGLNQQIASGASASRWSAIEEEADQSRFGNVVNFPFSAARDYWVSNKLSFDPTSPLHSDIPSLFITGDLDCRTPIAQINETMKGFGEAVHVVVKNAGHEQAHWDSEVFDKTIPAFMRGEEVLPYEAYYADLNFIKVKGKAKGHPALR